jgi:hypothetical protein
VVEATQVVFEIMVIFPGIVSGEVNRRRERLRGQRIFAVMIPS